MTDESRTPAELDSPAENEHEPVEGEVAAVWSESIWGRLGNAGWIFFALIAICAVFGVISPNHGFIHVQNLTNICTDTAELLILAVGETLVLVTGGVDLSVGGVLVLSGICASWVMLHVAGAANGQSQFEHTSLAIPLGVLAGLAIGSLMGFLNGLLVTRFRLPPFIVTLGMLGVTLGVADLITGGVDLTTTVPSYQRAIGYDSLAGIPVPVVIAAGCTLIIGVVLHFTVFGGHVFAVGSNDEGARRSGISPVRVRLAVYSLAGLLYGIAGLVDLGRFGTVDLASHGTDNLNAITAVVIGGTSLFGGVGTIFGTVMGAFIPNVLYNGFIIEGVNPFYQEVVIGLVVIAAVYVDSAHRARRAGRKD